MRAGEERSRFMTFGAPESTTTNSMRIPSIVILGADALVAALPATPIQFAHACALVGYQLVIPASWGDELIAVATMRALRDRAQLPAIQCSCPFVAHRLLAVGTDLRPFLVSLAAPPVVLARYLRAMHSRSKLRITYVGRCPGAGDEAIDARLTPEELLATFVDHQIDITSQPDAFDSILPPDRRRFRSQPGGLPTPEMLWSGDGNGTTPRALVELYGDEFSVELAQHLLAGKPLLIDVASKLGCVCSGAVAGVDPRESRARVTALEPPRASSPVIDETVVIDAALPLPASPRSAIDVVSPPVLTTSGPGSALSAPNDAPVASSAPPHAVGSPAMPNLATTSISSSPTNPRRLSPARGVPRPVTGNLPTARDSDGRQLPRTYVARRRPPVRVTRQAPDAEAPIAASSETTLPNEEAARPNVSARAGEVDRENGARAASASVPAAMPTPVPSPLESFEPASLPRPTAPRPSESEAEPARFSERAVALPVTPLSDGRRRDETSQSSGERPVIQLLTLGLLIAMIVLVSAAVGVLVGRWMSQH
jgi:hypothetical protein